MENQLKFEKPGAAVYLLNWCMFLVTAAYAMVLAYLVGTFKSVSQMMRVLYSWPCIIYYVILLGANFYIQQKSTAVFCAYDGTEESYKKCMPYYHLEAIFNVSTPIIGAVVLPLVVIFAARLANEEIGSYRLIYANINAVSFVAVFFYLTWIELWEEWLCFLPLKDNDVKFGVTNRIMTITGLMLLGSFAGALSIFVIVIEKNASVAADVNQITTIYIKKLLPIAILSLVLGVVDMYILCGYLMKRLHKINAFSARLANGDYTSSEIERRSRDEVGLVVTYINSFYRASKSLLEGVGKSVDSTRQVGNDLNANMTQTAATVQRIVSNINSVRDQMSTQSEIVDGATDAAENIRSCINKLTDNIRLQGQNVEESSAAVKELVQNVQGVTETLGKNGVTVGELGKASDVGQRRVEDAVSMAQKILSESTGLLEASNVIQNIAEQTNLLAMNAAIDGKKRKKCNL